MSIEAAMAGTVEGGRPTGFQRAAAWAPLLLLVAVFALFARTLGLGFYLDDYILARPWTGSEIGKAFTGAFDVIGTNDPYFRPLSSVSFALEWHLWGTDMWGYHLTNILLHAGATIGLYAVLRRIRVPWWSALIGAVVFAAIPANVTTVVYIAERTDAMVAIFVACGLLCVDRYHRRGRTGSLVALNAFFVLALLAKEVGVALVPMAMLFWWYLQIEALDGDSDRAARPDTTGTVWRWWKDELGRYWRALTRPEGRAAWLRLLGPLVAVLAIYLVYRQSVLPPGSLSDRFGETQNPISALLGGVRSALEGVPWEVSTLSFWPLVAAAVLAAALAPRARGWRVVLLGVGFVVAGVLPLSFSGGVEPRLLYVAESGVAVGVAGLTAILAEALANRRQRGRGRWEWVAVAAVGVAFAVGTIVTMVQSQNLFEPGSVKVLDADQRMWDNAGARPYIPPTNLEAIQRHLIDSGRIDSD
jgi:hypothetical protein